MTKKRVCPFRFQANASSTVRAKTKAKPHTFATKMPCSRLPLGTPIARQPATSRTRALQNDPGRIVTHQQGLPSTLITCHHCFSPYLYHEQSLTLKTRP